MCVGLGEKGKLCDDQCGNLLLPFLYLFVKVRKILPLQIRVFGSPQLPPLMSFAVQNFNPNPSLDAVRRQPDSWSSTLNKSSIVENPTTSSTATAVNLPVTIIYSRAKQVSKRSERAFLRMTVEGGA